MRAILPSPANDPPLLSSLLCPQKNKLQGNADEDRLTEALVSPVAACRAGSRPTLLATASGSENHCSCRRDMSLRGEEWGGDPGCCGKELEWQRAGWAHGSMASPTSTRPSGAAQARGGDSPPPPAPSPSPLEQAQHTGRLPWVQAAELGHAGDGSLLPSLQLLAIQDSHGVLSGQGRGSGRRGPEGGR